MPSGILLLDKPRGLSSNAALQRVRALYAREKAGHVGSLDPLATGMLPICLGEATKVAGDLLHGRKCYRFTIALGSATDTGDSAGAVSATAPVPSLAHEAIETALGRKAQRRLLPMQPGDVPLTYAGAELLQTLTGYRPTTPLAEGVAAFCEWFKAYKATLPREGRG